MVSRVNLIRTLSALAVVSYAVASGENEPPSVQTHQKDVALSLGPQGLGPKEPPITYGKWGWGAAQQGWGDAQQRLRAGLKESTERLESDPQTLKKMLKQLIVEAKNDTLSSADGFSLKERVGFLVDSVCKKLDITDVQVITNFKAMMGAELQKYTKNYAAKLYLPNTIVDLSKILIATLEK